MFALGYIFMVTTDVIYDLMDYSKKDIDLRDGTIIRSIIIVIFSIMMYVTYWVNRDIMDIENN